MRSSCALLAFAAGVLAQIPGLPSCAQGCIQLPASCQTTDFKCICGNQDFVSNISCCVAKGCSESDQDTVIKFAQGICGSYGVALPMHASCASASGSASAAGSAAGSSGVSSTAAPMTGTAGPSMTAFVVNGTMTTTATVSVTDTTTTTASVATASSVSPRTGAAANVGPEAGIFLGGVMAGMALL